VDAAYHCIPPFDGFTGVPIRDSRRTVYLHAFLKEATSMIPATVRKYVGKIALLLTSIIMSLFIAEGVLRYYNPFPSRIHGTSIRLPRNIRYQFRNDSIVKIDPLIFHTKNSLGFRGPDPPTSYDRALTIIAVGGSTTECLLLSDGHDWPALVEKRLRDYIPKLWVNNAGIGGASTIGHLEMLRQLVLPLRPKIVLFLVGINDVGRSTSNDADDPDRELTPIPWRSAVTHFHWLLAFKAAGFTIAEHSEVASLLLNLYRGFLARRRGLDDMKGIVLVSQPHEDGPTEDSIARLREQHAPFLEAYRERLINLVVTCRKYSIEPVLITQPVLYGTGTDPVTAVNLATVRVSPGLNGRTEWMVLEWYNDITRAVGREHHVKVIDLAREMPKSSEYYYDFMHYTNQGADKVAEVISMHLLPFVKEQWPDYVSSSLR
jgi:lysophospholipase L1-like esterase